MALFYVVDSDVQMTWKCEEEDCPEGNPEVTVYPTFYQDNGTPMCGCDSDMVYQYTEVEM